MKRKPFVSLVITLLAALLATPGLQVPAGGSPPGSITGTLLDPGGVPLAGATVELAVVPPGTGKNAAMRPKTFAATSTDDAGAFVLDGAPSGLSRLAQRNGSVELLVTGSSGDQAVHHSILAEAPTASTSAWSRQGTRETVPPLHLQLGGGDVAEGVIGSRATAADPVEVAPSANRADDSAVAGSGASQCRDGYAMVWVPLDKYQRRYPPVQRLTTRAHSKQQYEFENTEETQLEAAFTGDGGNYAGGFTYSKTHNLSAGMKWQQGNRKSRVLRVGWQYRKHQKKCYNGRPHQTYLLDVFWWRADRLSSGSRLETNAASWTCTTRTTERFAVETWVARTSTVTWSGFFQVAGVKLDDRQTNTSQHRYTVFPDRGEVSAKICGDNDLPLYADRVKERR